MDSVDIVAVGAGVIGCAIAHELARRGATVRLLESRQVGGGATRGSAGVLCPWIGGSADALLPALLESVGLYDAFITSLRGGAGPGVEYRRNGTIEVALDDTELVRLQSLAAAYRAAGAEHEWLDATRLRAKEPAVTERARAGVFVPSHGYVDVVALNAALAAAATRAGASIEVTGPVLAVEPMRHGVRVRTAAQVLVADAVVVAAGAWSGQVAVSGASPAPVRPIRGQLLRLHGKAPRLDHMIWSSRCYLVPRNDGSLLVGATHEDVGFDERTTMEGVGGLLAGACEVIPEAVDAEYEARAGLRPATPDGVPIIGRSHHMPGLVYATGHHRNGIMLAPLTARMVADLVLEGREHPLRSLMSPARYGL